MNESKTTVNPKARPASRCSAWLGVISIRDGWQHYLMLLACLFSFWVCGKILWEEYGHNFHRKQRNGKDEQRPSEPDDAPRRNLSQLAGQNKNLRLSAGNLNRRKIMSPLVLHQVGNFLLKCGNAFLKLFRFTHGARMTPNV